MKQVNYLKHKYPIVLTPISPKNGGGWLAEIPLLPGCVSDGETPEKAVQNLEKAKKAWFKVALERNQSILTHEKASQLEAERDKALEDLYYAHPCFACINSKINNGECTDGGKCDLYEWQWRGI